MRYVIKVLKGRKVINVYKFDDYIDAMDMLDVLESKSMRTGTIVEFRDMDPFARQ